MNGLSSIGSRAEATRVVVINDYARKGGAEEVYQTSIEVLRNIPDVDVYSFDETSFAPGEGAFTRGWNRAAANALAALLDEVRPHHVLVHNYHNLLTQSILPVLARRRREQGFRTYLTCHDYHLVFYNPNLLTYRDGRPVPVPVDALSNPARLFALASPRGRLHDTVKKLHWHAVYAYCNPRDIFDVFLCPSPYMRTALAQRGITNSALLPNPVSRLAEPFPPRVCVREQFDLAYVGRLDPEKGIHEFIELARRTDFRRIGSLTLYGDGLLRAELEARHQDLVQSERLRFAGRLGHDALFHALRAHDALVLPSVWAENAPLVMVEAATLGLPVLAHEIGSLSTFGSEIGNKILYRNSPAGLTGALDELNRHLRTAGRHYDCSAYTPAHYAAQLASWMGLGGQQGH
ncbi:glycosyltransferase family 4 protein [Burkholderia lata]|uniref:glycosyltransferase family 4 protein n=1 Tax=Burkholderia lata (strain ATCC 17760 / DSM 23089 / LMG 22485 / NCIMB 9086 / R18194 / 383) TaxID=482957 RepID=UPI0014545EB9|nr:glycosyltransferase [Burkholderia lata]VWB09080.1 glycosyl transferase [Burkholderia lata]